jgi:hypothetical protein
MEKIVFFTCLYSSADKVSAGGGLKEEGEEIDVIETTLEEAAAMIVSGEIVDAKTVVLVNRNGRSAGIWCTRGRHGLARPAASATGAESRCRPKSTSIGCWTTSSGWPKRRGCSSTRTERGGNPRHARGPDRRRMNARFGLHYLMEG